MACNCSQNQTDCNPCPTCSPADATCECLPSQIDNFTKEFFGTVTKSVVDGAVVWTLPCDLAVGLENNPRLTGEGLACYFLRLFGEGITGLTGPQGAQGEAGEDGDPGYWVVSIDFTQPADDCPSTTLYLENASGLSAEARIWIPGSGYYRVLSVAGNSVFVQIVSATGTAGTVVPAGTAVYLTGPEGATGAAGAQGDTGATGPAGPTGPIGAAGPSATTTCLTNFTQPAPGSNTAALTFVTTALMEAGQTLYLVGGGYYEVVSVVSNTATLKNLYDEPANAAAGANVNASGTALAIVAGARGRGAYTYTTANFTQPAVGNTVVVSVVDSTVFVADTYLHVEGGGVYYISAIGGTTSVTLRNEGSLDAAAPAATISSGAKVVPTGQPGARSMSVVSYSAGPVTFNTQDLAVVDASAAPVVVNLPAVASSSGRVYRVKKTDATANAVTLTANGAETIDGSNTQALTSQYDSLTVVCDGTEWHII